MSQKSLLITGCSSGIGYDVAHTFHKRGWRVFTTCRQQADCKILQSEGLESFQLDYADEASIENAVAETFSRTGGTLDALFNNGAYAIPGAVEDLPRDALRAIFEVNFFGQFDLANRILPAMKAQGSGRIAFNSSVLGLTARRFRGAYNATKFAMEGMVDTMRMENLKSPVNIILVEPGPVTSKIRQNAIPHFEKWIDRDRSAHKQVYEQTLIPRLYDESGKKDPFELPASAVSRKLVHALESKRPHPRYFVTTPTYFMNLMRRILPTRGMDYIAGRV